MFVYKIRPDAYYVWENPVVRSTLSWYYRVFTNEVPAKFLLVRGMEVGEERLAELSTTQLWRLHDSLHKEFEERIAEISNNRTGMDWKSFVKKEKSFLDVKIEISRRMSSPCILCERRCMADRKAGDRRAVCRLGIETIVSSAFIHYGEEAPLVPSGTIFYGGCNLKCVYCQNFDISQTRPPPGEIVSARELARIQERLRNMGARNINHVGGEPTPHLPTIVESLKYLRTCFFIIKTFKRS
jgi:putative pyruvate formate lyase activating enzyme